LRFKEIYGEGEEHPFSAFPKLTTIALSVLAGPQVDDYVKNRRDG
jgi:hypothetical protein